MPPMGRSAAVGGAGAALLLLLGKAAGAWGRRQREHAILEEVGHSRGLGFFPAGVFAGPHHPAPRRPRAAAAAVRGAAGAGGAAAGRDGAADGGGAGGQAGRPADAPLIRRHTAQRVGEEDGGVGVPPPPDGEGFSPASPRRCCVRAGRRRGSTLRSTWAAPTSASLACAWVRSAARWRSWPSGSGPSPSAALTPTAARCWRT